jgi:hypothetical protein
MTPEEQAAYDAYVESLQNNPLSYALNAFGQGNGFMDYSKTPVQFDRQGDVNQLYRDAFGMTGVPFESLVSGLYPEPAMPGNREPYQSDTNILYANNPAYDQVAQLVASGENFDNAVDVVFNDKEYKQFLPKGSYSQDSQNMFRSSAATYLTESARTNREQGIADKAQAEWDDFVRTRTNWEMNPGADNINNLLRSERDPSRPLPEMTEGGFFGPQRNVINPATPAGTTFIKPNQPGNVVAPVVSQIGRFDRTFDGSFPSVVTETQPVVTGPRAGAPGIPRVPTERPPGRSRNASTGAVSSRPTERTGRSTASPSTEGQSGQATGPLPLTGRNVYVDDKGRTSSQIEYDKNKELNDMMQKIYGQARSRRENQQVMSKQQENDMRKIQTYVDLINAGS